MQDVQQCFKSPFRRLKPYHLYITRPQAGLLNKWGLADQTRSVLLLPQNLFGCLLIRLWWLLELGVGGEDPEEGHLMLWTTLLRILNPILAVSCPYLLSFVPIMCQKT